MSYLDVSHIAVNVPNVREAEAFYRGLFDLEVAWRDSNGGASLFASWAEIDAAGATPKVIMLWRDAFRLAITSESDAAGSGALSHVGLQVTRERLVGIRSRVMEQDLRVMHEAGDEQFSFIDPHGISWELDIRSFKDPTLIGRQAEERQKQQRS